MRTRLLFLALLGLTLACNRTATPRTKQVVAMETVPAIVIKAAQTSQPDVKFDTVIKADGFYEVRGKNKAGKVIEVEVSEAGEVLQVE